MPSRLSTRVLARAATRIPVLRNLPVLKLLALGEVALLARDHLGRLDPVERRRLFTLVREGRGRARNLGPDERAELAKLVAKVEPRQFAGLAANRISPFPLPRRVVHGPDRR